MEDTRFFTIGNIEHIPPQYVNKFNLNYSQYNETIKYPKYIDNVFVFINNILDYEERFRLENIGNKPHVRYGVNTEKTPMRTCYKKLFIIVNDKLSNLPIKSKFGSDVEIIYNELNDWDQVFQTIEKNLYIKPWYLSLWEAIPSWPSL